MMSATVTAMSFLDWVALLLCSYMIGLTLVGEIKVRKLANLLTFACVG